MHFRVSYNYIGPKNVLRSGALVIEAKDAVEAKRRADEQLKKTQETAYEIVGAKPFGAP